MFMSYFEYSTGFKEVMMQMTTKLLFTPKESESQVEFSASAS